MDKSELFIKQCDCPEIQDKWLQRFSVVDYCFSKKTKEHGIYHFVKKQWRENPLKDFTWLPRQDQIQEMMGGNIEDVFLGRMGNGEFDELDRFVDFFYENYSMHSIDSMEKLWLAFYMYEKHSKIWDGEKWVKE